MKLIIIFLIVLFIFLLVYSKNIERYNNFPTEADDNLTNCYYYINKFKNISLGLENQPEKLHKRKQILYDLDAVRSTQNMLTNRNMYFTGGCAINKSRDLEYLKSDLNCNITGNVLIDEIDEDGYKKTESINIKTKNQREYAFPNITPKYACYIDSTDQTKFFETIDKLADIKYYEQDKKTDRSIVDQNNYKNKLATVKDAADVYGLDLGIENLKLNLRSKCRDIEGDPVYDKTNVNIKCNSDEVLNSIKFNKINDQYSVNYKCCNIGLADNTIIPVIKETSDSCITNNTDFNHNPGLINGIENGIFTCSYLDSGKHKLRFYINDSNCNNNDGVMIGLNTCAKPEITHREYESNYIKSDSHRDFMASSTINASLKSKNNKFKAILNNKGELLILKEKVPVWKNKYSGLEDFYILKIQSNGQIFIKNKSTGTVLYASDVLSAEQGPFTLKLEDDGNLILYDKDLHPFKAF